MVDTLETAAACGLSLTPRRRDEPTVRTIPEPVSPQPAAFSDLIESWFPLTYVLNNLNRGLGHPDAYPFVLSPSAVAKLKFVDDVVGRAKVGGGAERQATWRRTSGSRRLDRYRSPCITLLSRMRLKAVFSNANSCRRHLHRCRRVSRISQASVVMRSCPYRAMRP